jgi:hypothetical protein
MFPLAFLLIVLNLKRTTLLDSEDPDGDPAWLTVSELDCDQMLRAEGLDGCESPAFSDLSACEILTLTSVSLRDEVMLASTK